MDAAALNVAIASSRVELEVDFPRTHDADLMPDAHTMPDALAIAEEGLVRDGPDGPWYPESQSPKASPKARHHPAWDAAPSSSRPGIGRSLADQFGVDELSDV